VILSPHKKQLKEEISNVITTSDGVLLKEDTDIANGICTYFSEVGSNISRQINNNARSIEITTNINMLDTVNSVFTQDDMMQIRELYKNLREPIEYHKSIKINKLLNT
jgi:hypothetical protein